MPAIEGRSIACCNCRYDYYFNLIPDFADNYSLIHFLYVTLMLVLNVITGL
jgi:hypothetical protein